MPRLATGERHPARATRRAPPGSRRPARALGNPMLAGWRLWSTEKKGRQDSGCWDDVAEDLSGAD